MIEIAVAKEVFGEVVLGSVHTDWGDAQSWVEATPEWEGEEVGAGMVLRSS